MELHKLISIRKLWYTTILHIHLCNVFKLMKIKKYKLRKEEMGERASKESKRQKLAFPFKEKGIDLERLDRTDQPNRFGADRRDPKARQELILPANSMSKKEKGEEERRAWGKAGCAALPVLLFSTGFGKEQEWTLLEQMR